MREAIRLILIGSGLSPKDISVKGFSGRQATLEVIPLYFEHARVTLERVGYHTMVNDRGLVVTR